MDRDGQIKAIEKTFEDNKRSIERHYSKSNVVPVEILPVFPDFKVQIHIKLLFTYLHWKRLINFLYSIIVCFLILN